MLLIPKITMISLTLTERSFITTRTHKTVKNETVSSFLTSIKNNTYFGAVASSHEPCLLWLISQAMPGNAGISRVTMGNPEMVD